jgi:L-threonylcarbamoyladenylate synthase
MLQRLFGERVAAAAALLRSGVMAYRTEAVFGLGRDPHDHAACMRLFALKQQPATQGVLLIAADFARFEPYIDVDAVPPAVMHAPLVSTSASPHDASSARDADTVVGYFGAVLDGLFDNPLGGQARPTTIRNARSGATVRA